MLAPRPAYLGAPRAIGRPLPTIVAPARPFGRKGRVVKYVGILRLAPGVENTRKALEIFMKAGSAQGTQALYASADGKTFVVIIESDTIDMVSSYTYAPFWEDNTVIPVVDVDDAWLQAIQAAQANWD